MLIIWLSPFKNTNFTDAEAKLTIRMRVDEDDYIHNKFYSIGFRIGKNQYTIPNWTLAHSITESSPFYLFTKEDFESIEGEILVFIKLLTICLQYGCYSNVLCF